MLIGSNKLNFSVQPEQKLVFFNKTCWIREEKVLTLVKPIALILFEPLDYKTFNLTTVKYMFKICYMMTNKMITYYRDKVAGPFL